MSEIIKCPKGLRGGGNPNWDIVPNFLDFYFDASPYKALTLTVKYTTHSEKIILSRHDSKTITKLIPALTQS